MRDDPRLWHPKFEPFYPDTAGMKNKKIAKILYPSHNLRLDSDIILFVIFVAQFK
jgi:hypothetical protein